MSDRQAQPETSQDRELVITRHFPAPRPLVFRAWTDPQHLAKWWGPPGCVSTIRKLELRVGGIFELDMRLPDGAVYSCRGTFQEIVEPERIVLAGPPDCEHACGAGLPPRSTVTVTFEEQRGGTKLTLLTRFASAADLAAALDWGVEPGWAGTLERLDELLSDAIAQRSPRPDFGGEGQREEASAPSDSPVSSS